MFGKAKVYKFRQTLMPLHTGLVKVMLKVMLTDPPFLNAAIDMLVCNGFYSTKTQSCQHLNCQ